MVWFEIYWPSGHKLINTNPFRTKGSEWDWLYKPSIINWNFIYIVKWWQSIFIFASDRFMVIFFFSIPISMHIWCLSPAVYVLCFMTLFSQHIGRWEFFHPLYTADITPSANRLHYIRNQLSVEYGIKKKKDEEKQKHKQKVDFIHLRLPLFGRRLFVLWTTGK